MSIEEQHIEPELSVGEIIRLYLSQWKMFAFFTVVLFVGSVLYFAYSVPFKSSASIVISDSQNSAMQAFSNQYFGLSKSVQESKKGNSLLAKHIEYLKTREFYELLLKKIEDKGNSPKITLEERQGFDKFKEFYLEDVKTPEERVRVLQALNSWIRVEQNSEFEVGVSAVTPDRNMSLFLANVTADLATGTLRERELDEINRVENFMTKQRDEADKNLENFSKKLAEMQNKDESLLPLGSKGKMEDYVSELLVRSNELKLEISENNKMIAYLNQGRKGQRESALYGVGGQIEALKLKNSMLKEKLAEVQTSIGRLKKEVRGLPYAAQMVEDLKKKSELEFARFKELTTSLAKLEAQKLSIDMRFEILERARWETTKPKISLLTLGLLSVLLSQLLGSLIIYFRYLWNPHVVTAQASRNLVIYDHHSVDPRVIIENSKIKFSLKKPESKAEELADSKESSNKTWNVVNVSQGNDLIQ